MGFRLRIQGLGADRIYGLGFWVSGLGNGKPGEGGGCGCFSVQGLEGQSLGKSSATV